MPDKPSVLVPPMLAKGYPDSSRYASAWQSPHYWTEPKIDETRHLFYMEGPDIWIYSRRVSTVTKFYIDNSDKVPHIKNFLRRWRTAYQEEHGTELGLTVLDGGLMRGKELAAVSSVLNMTYENAAKAQATGGRVEAVIWDIPFYNGMDMITKPLSYRRAVLEKIAEKYHWPIRAKWEGDAMHPVVLIPKCVGTEEEKKAFYQKCLDDGFEGVILKDDRGQYEPNRRSPVWLKVKRLGTWDVIITGFNKGTNSNADVYSTFNWGQYIMGNLKELGVCGGLTQEQMVEFTRHPELYVGKVAEIAGQERTVHGDVRHPRFIRLRDDKAAEQCVWDPDAV